LIGNYDTKELIKINDSVNNVFYYVSNVQDGALTIIDGSCNSIVNTVFVGIRPFKLAVLANNKICVACERSNSISIVDCLSYKVSEIAIPNDGNIEIDKLNNKIFVSNTSEILVYDIVTEKIIATMIGFLSITAIKLCKGSSRLYVLDKLLSEFRIYSTVNYKQIYGINNIGINPGYFLISEDDKTAYVSMENNEDTIIILDVSKKKIRPLKLPKGSLISGMAIKGNILYAANKGLNRIELINVETCYAYGFIETSRAMPNRIFITEDETKLLVVNRNNGGKGSLDIIDTSTNNLIGKVIMDSQNSQPFDVVSVSVQLHELSDIPLAITDLKADKEPIIIITKRVFACHRDNMDFPNISINLAEDINLLCSFEKIIFQDGAIVNGSLSRKDIDDMPGFSRIQFLIRITYTVYYLENSENICIFQGFLEKEQNIILAIPRDRDVNEFELRFKCKTKLINTSSLVGNVIKFRAMAFWEIKIIGEDEIILENAEKIIDTVEEQYETFLGCSGSIFPEGTVIPYLD